MKVHRAALPRTDVTVKEFLSDLCDPGHAVRRFAFAADTRIARMYWPEKVSYANDAQMPGWTCYGFSPFGNMSDAVALVRHAVREPRIRIEIEGDATRVTLFSQSLQAGACAEDAEPTYAVCKAFLNACLVFDGAMYGYVLGMGIARPGYERPTIHPEEVLRHEESGDILRNGLGSKPRAGDKTQA